MKKADLHVHSKFSGTASLFFLQKTQIYESYTEPEKIYQLAKEKGMDFVTVTDHNSIDGIKKLCQSHPEDTFMGVELSVYFPEDNTEIHILVYDFTENQFNIMNQKRKNIYELRDYLFQEKLIHSVAHATYSVNQKLTFDHLEKLILLFDNFETINGCRSSASNETWKKTLKLLNQDKIQNLAVKYDLKLKYPISCEKGFTGGSDDHSGLWIGHTYTMCPGKNLGGFLQALKSKQSTDMGNNGNYRYMTANFIKIAHHCLQQKQPQYSRKISGKLADHFFNLQSFSFIGRMKLLSLYWISLLARKKFIPLIIRTIYHLLSKRTSMEERINGLYHAVSQLVDEMILQVLSSLSEDLKKGKIKNLFSKSMLLIEALFAMSPFMITLREQHQQKKILTQLHEQYLDKSDQNEKRILWFTDTFNDLNGVSATLKDIFHISKQQQLPLKFVISERSSQNKDFAGNDTINLDSIYEIPLPFYEHYNLKIPSILNALQRISEEKPSHIYISTIGPIGAMGLIMASLMHIPVVGIYHTDYTAQSKMLTDQGLVHQSLRMYEQWFFGQMDTVIVHSMDYRDKLIKMGIEPDSIKWCPKGIDTKAFSFHPQYPISPDSLVLLYTGRISSDKNIDFLLQVFQNAKKRIPQLKLWMAGDGPLLKTLDNDILSHPDIRWYGRMDRSDLVDLYQKADIFVFPSNSDTFGMSVLEAQLCGLPAIVSDSGGPKEIIEDQKTGFICSTTSIDYWISAIEKLNDERKTNPEYWQNRKSLCRSHAVKNRDWDFALPKILDLPAPSSFIPQYPVSGVAF